MRAFPQRRFAVLAARTLTVPFVVTLTLTTGGGVAYAEDVAVELPVMYFGFDPNPTSLTLCGNGFLREPPSPNPSWTLDVYGIRSSLTLITGSDAAFGPSAFVCVTVQKNNAQEGTYTAVFRYQAFPSDPPSQIAAQVVWFPGTEGEVVSTSQ